MVTPSIAAVIYCSLILGLFWLDRDPKARTSAALWIPVVWFGLACSRPVREWLQWPSLGSPEEYADGSPIDRKVYTTLLILAVVILASRQRTVGKYLRSNILILSFFLFCAISLLWSDFPIVALRRWFKALGDVVMVLVVLTDREPSTALKRLLTRLGYVLIPLSVLLIKYFPNLGRGYGFWEGEVAYTGAATNKNALGALCLLVGLGFAWRFLVIYRDREGLGRTRRLIAYSVTLGMVLWLLWKANSMTSLGCFLLAICLLLLASSRFAARTPMAIHAFVATVLAVCVSILFLGIGSSALGVMGRNPTLTDRTQVWALLLGLVRNPVFGTGFESFWLGPRLEQIWSVYRWRPTEAHNGYLEIYLNLGWLGVAFLMAVIAQGYRAVFKAWRSNAFAGSLRLAYLLVGLVFNFTEAAFFKMMAPVWLFFLLAMMISPQAVDHDTRKDFRSDQIGVNGNVKLSKAYPLRSQRKEDRRHQLVGNRG